MEADNQRGGGWESEPPANEGLRVYELVRPEPGRGLEVIITSADMIGRPMHYWAGRSRPCTKASCEICKKGWPPRWKGFIGAIDERNGRKYIVELTAAVARQVRELHKKFRTLRGIFMKLTRANDKPNSKVFAKFKDPNEMSKTLKLAPDVRPILMTIWELTSDGRLANPEQEHFPLRATGTDDWTPDGNPIPPLD